MGRGSPLVVASSTGRRKFCINGSGQQFFNLWLCCRDWQWEWVLNAFTINEVCNGGVIVGLRYIPCENRQNGIFCGVLFS